MCLKYKISDPARHMASKSGEKQAEVSKQKIPEPTEISARSPPS